MQQALQASDVSIEIIPLVNGKALDSVVAATYVLFNKSGVAVTKTLGNGVVFTSNKRLEVSLTETDTEQLLGTYEQECVIRDFEGKDIFVLESSPINFKKTTGRIQV